MWIFWWAWAPYKTIQTGKNNVIEVKIGPKTVLLYAGSCTPSSGFSLITGDRVCCRSQYSITQGTALPCYTDFLGPSCVTLQQAREGHGEHVILPVIERMSRSSWAKHGSRLPSWGGGGGGCQCLIPAGFAGKPLSLSITCPDYLHNAISLIVIHTQMMPLQLGNVFYPEPVNLSNGESIRPLNK